jgi:predicted naringenin-chalcone synthase
MKRDKPTPSTWRPPTRRVFVSMLGAAAAALALRTKEREARAEPAKKPKPRWIGHC